MKKRIENQFLFFFFFFSIFIYTRFSQNPSSCHRNRFPLYIRPTMNIHALTSRSKSKEERRRAKKER